MGGFLIDQNFTTWNFIAMHGQVRDVTTDLEELSQPGVKGTATRDLAQRGGIFPVVAVFDSDSRATAALDAQLIQQLKGTVLKLFVDDYGTDHGPMIVWDVEPLKVQDLVTSVGHYSTFGKAMVVARLTLQKLVST